ncbi:MAG: site-specific integrase [Pseudolabrys sp.]|nr:site-specific integrase [Pseudolabrys sp.]
MGVGTRKWKKADGTVCKAYIVRWSDSEGRHIKTFDRKKDADSFDAQMQLDKASGKHVALPRKLTVAEAGENWIHDTETRPNPGRPQTLAQYRQHLRDHIKPMLGTARIADLTRDRCKQFARDLLKRKMVGKEQTLSPETAVKIWVSFKSIMRHAGRGAVVDGIDFQKPDNSEKTLAEAKDYPTINEVRRIAGKIDNVRDRAVFAILAGCGLRGGELRALRWSDINWEKGYITVSRSADRFDGFGPTKTKAGRRLLPLPAEARADLTTWKAQCAESAKARAAEAAVVDEAAEAEEAAKALIFSKPDGKPLHHHTLVRALNGAQEAAGVVDTAGRAKYALHAFRHFFASWSLARIEDGGRGFKLHIVSKLLGHANETITQTVYNHIEEPDEDSEFLAAASTLFGTADKVVTQAAQGAKILSINS